MSQISTITSRGKLTGEEVGRLFLRDYARLVKAVQEDKEPPKSKFTDAEKQEMVNQLEDNQDIDTYNTYVGINRFLQKMVMLYMQEYDQIKTLFPLLPRLVEEAKHQQAVALFNNDAPLIMTPKQYEELKAKDLKAKLSKTTTIAGVILKAVYEANRAEEGGKKTPYHDLLEAYKQQPLTNPRFIENYWETGSGYYVTPEGKSSRDMSSGDWVREVNKWRRIEADTGEEQVKWVTDRTAPPDANKHNIIEYIDKFFDIDSPTQEEYNTFKADYPELHDLILKELRGLKNPGFNLKGVKPEDYTKTPVSYKALYESRNPYYLDYFIFTPGEGKFLAVIPPEQLPRVGYWIDDKGYYRYRREEWERQNLTVTLPGFLAKLLSHLKALYRIREAYRILGERIGEQSVIDLANEEIMEFEDKVENTNENTSDFIRAIKETRMNEYIRYGLEHINGDIEDLKYSLKYKKGRSLVLDEKTEREIRQDIDALPMIELRDCKPLKENIKKAKEIGKDLRVYDTNPFLILDALKGIV